MSLLPPPRGGTYRELGPAPSHITQSYSLRTVSSELRPATADAAATLLNEGVGTTFESRFSSSTGINPGFALRGTSSLVNSTESLPHYAPRDAGLIQKYRHAIDSPNKRLELLLDSLGSRSHPIYVQSACSTISGKVVLRLQGYEKSAESLRLRVMGLMTTHVLRPQRGQVYKVISDEVEFWQDSVTLWTASEALTAQQSQECVFPFTVTIPEETSPSARLPQTVAMPPSFASAENVTVGGVFSASIRYVVKVTLARRGLLKSNERLLAPIIYLPRQLSLSFLSEPRRHAILCDGNLAAPNDAGDSWQQISENKILKSGLFGNKQANYSFRILIPKPSVFGKIETLPYYIQIAAAPSTLVLFGPENISVLLLQRTRATAQGAVGSQEIAVAHGITILDPERSDTNALQLKGSMKLRSAPSVTFHTHIVNVTYWLVCNLVSSSNINRVQDRLVSIPIKLVSIPPMETRSLAEQSNSLRPPPDYGALSS